jgi:dTDP-4-dehydrorhamnose reductase
VGQVLDPLLSGEPTVLDDVIVRFPIWIRDIADAIAFLEAKKADGTFHLSGPRGETRYAWTLEVANELGYKTKHLTPSKTVVPRRADRPLNSQLQTNKIQSLGYSSFTDFPQVVRSVIAAFP